MSLIEHSTPAERARGCSLAEGFESQAAVEADGWTVTGVPTFDPADGVTLDGSSDYLTLPLCGSEFNSAGLSVVIEFTPDFDPTEDAIRYLFQAKDSGTGVLLVKSNAGASYTLGLHMGGTSIAQIALAAYQGAWLTGQRNVLVVSGTTGDTSVWLNGTKILDADATAWTPEAATTLAVGAAVGGGSKFAGEIHRIQVYKAQLEDQEALDICNGSTYRYLDNASLILTGAMEDHDPTNKRVLDRSGNGNHVTLGDGAGTGEPTKLAGAGYKFAAASSQYMQVPLAAWPGANGTVAIDYTQDDQTGNGRMFGSDDSGGSADEMRSYSDPAGVKTNLAHKKVGGGIGAIDIQKPVAFGVVNVALHTWTRSGASTSMAAFSNGFFLGNTVVADEYAAPDKTIWLGRWDASYLNGTIRSLVLIPNGITTLQSLDLTHRMRSWARGV